MKDKTKPVKQITVSPNPDYVIWNEDLDNIVRDTEVIIGPGCQAIYMVDGAISCRIVADGLRTFIKSKEEEKRKCDLKLICINTGKTFELFVGGGNIPFKDYDLNAETLVGAHGKCNVRVMDAYKLYTTIGHCPITADEIGAYVKLKLSEIMTTRLAEVLQHYDYNNITTQKSSIADDLVKKFSDALYEIGMDITSFAFAGIMFDDEYQEKRQAHFDAENQRKLEKEERRRKEREQRNEIDNIVAIANATKNIDVSAPAAPSAPVTPPAPNAPGVNQPVKYCPRCGMKMEQSAVFCPGCGKKL